MTEFCRAVTTALAVVGGITLCVLFAALCINLKDLFDRVDDLEEVVGKHEQAIKRDERCG